MLKEKLYSDKRERFAFIIIALYAITVFMFDADEAKLKFIYLAYGLLCLTLAARMGGIKLFREAIPLAAYLGFGVLSIIWSSDRSLSITRIKGVFLLLVLLVILSSYLAKIEKPIQLLAAIALGGLAMTVYLFALYGVSGVFASITQAGNRLGSKVNAINSVAHALTVVIVTITGICVFYRLKKLLLVLIPIGICFLGAESRTATLSLIVGILLMVYLYINSTGDEHTRFSRFIIALVVIVAVLAIVRTLPVTRNLILKAENSLSIIKGEGSFLKESSTETRLDYISKGWEQFLKSPLWGNGIGCAGYAIVEDYGKFTYLHNNYIEMLASGGIIGFALYYAPYLMLLNTFRKRIFVFRENNPVIMISFALLIAKLVAHFGTVVYYSKIEFLLLTLWIAVANTPLMEEMYYEDGENEEAEITQEAEESNG